MPACPRKEIVLEGEVGVYHCWGGCVRRAWLCGLDPLTGRDFGHRREWLACRERLLAGLFAIEVGFHAELANHLHVVLRTRPDIVETWSDEEVVTRWLRASKLTRRLDDVPIEPDQKEIERELNRPERVAEFRMRLASVSWLMKSLRENIAVRANAEDQTRGHFWDGRFQCRRLEEEGAILICGIYVDLNQIRAGEALTPEESRHTSAYERILGRRQRGESSDQGCAVPVSADSGKAHGMPPDGWLCNLALDEGPRCDVQAGLRSTTPWRASDKGLLRISLDQYLELLDWTGRQVRDGKRGAIPGHLAPILERLQVRKDQWVDAVLQFDRWFHGVVGHAGRLADAAARTGRRWIGGVRRCGLVFT